MWAWFCDWDVLTEIKEGSLWSFNWQTGKKQSRVFRGSFIHLSLSNSDKGQALTKAEVRSGSVTSSCQTITAAGLKAAHCLSASRTSQHRERGERLTPNTEKLLIQGELGWLHGIATYKRVMSSVLMYINQEKQMSFWIWTTSNHFSGQDISVHFGHKITNHLPDPACEDSFRLNVINLTQNDNNNTRMNYCTI